MATFEATSSRRITVLKEIGGQYYRLTLEIRVSNLWIFVERILPDDKIVFIMESDLHFEFE